MTAVDSWGKRRGAKLDRRRHEEAMRLTKRNTTWAKVAAIVAGIALLSPAAKAVYNAATWRSRETRLLESLTAGQATARFIEKLGAPDYRRHISKYDLDEYIFRERGLWVQVLDRAGTALQYAVTVCDPMIQVSLRAGDSSVTTGAPAPPIESGRNLRLVVSIATANSYWTMNWYGGNPTSYRTLAQGENDTCGESNPRQSLSMYDAIDRGKSELKDSGASLTLEKYVVAGWQLVRSNTVAVTAPHGEYIFDPEEGLYLGPNRVLVRE